MLEAPVFHPSITKQTKITHFSYYKHKMHLQLERQKHIKSKPKITVLFILADFFLSTLASGWYFSPADGL
jgi:hypothetical protein